MICPGCGDCFACRLRAKGVAAALVEHAVGDLQTWQTQLRALANHLEDLEARSRVGSS